MEGDWSGGIEEERVYCRCRKGEKEIKREERGKRKGDIGKRKLKRGEARGEG